MRLALLSLAVLLPLCGFSQNLITNGGAESATVGSGWIIVSNPGNTSCTSTAVNWRVQGTAISTAPHSGDYIFYPGCNAATGGTYEIYQDVDVSTNATAIRTGNATYTFVGWYSSYNQANPDQCRFIEEYRDSTNAVLSSYSSALLTSATNTSATQSPWVRLVNTAAVPVATRKIRIRLQAVHSAGSAIDAYFDDLSLVSGSAPLPLSLNGLMSRIVTGGVELQWKDENAHDQVGYNIYWSKDGTGWQQAGYTSVYDVNKNNGSYSFVHQDPSTGKNYYRVASLSKNGDLNYSQVVNTTMASGKTVDFVMAPNPANTALHITLNGSSAIAAITNMQGQKIRQLSLVNGTNKVDVSSIPAGNYMLSLTTEEGTDNKLLVITR